MSPAQAGCFSGIINSLAGVHLPKRGGEHRKHASSIKHSSAKEWNEKEPSCCYLNPACDFSYSSQWWTDEQPPSYNAFESAKVYRPDVLDAIETKLDEISSDLRKLSLQIHGHPELMFQEGFAHDLLTNFLSQHGFAVTKHFLGLDTAWRAEFTHLKGSRVIGINSEMDALKGMGHACGHNLIAISGVGVAIAIKAALEAHSIPGKIILLGTPAEESGGGKVILLERGGYDEMDACLMCHPSPGPAQSASTGTSNAMQSIQVEYFGHAAHAGAAPWEGTNALDAAFLAYSSISVLRQQMKPDHRVHGVIGSNNWSSNVIPDYANMTWNIRAPTYQELAQFRQRVVNCFQSAALATSCKVVINMGLPYYDLHQNSILAKAFSETASERYGMSTSDLSTTASTDFGNVSYALPSLHPMFAIPTRPNGGNHTPEFADSARTMEAHIATMTLTKVLSLIGVRVLDDPIFFANVKKEHDLWKSSSTPRQ